MATNYPVDDVDMQCDQETDVIPDQTFTYTSSCTKGIAAVSLFVYDDSFNSTSDPSVPSLCHDDSHAEMVGNKVAYDFLIPCGCDSSTDQQTLPDPQSCDPTDISFDDDHFEPGAYVSLQWSELGIVVSGDNHDGSGGYTPDGKLRLFDTSEPTNSSGYGTPDLSGAYGNVLIIQESGGSSQWKANEAGGVMEFDFSSGLSQVVDLGLLNIVDDVKIHITGSTGTRKTRLVRAAGAKSEKTISLNVDDVAKMEIVLTGPTAVTHVGVCTTSAPKDPIDICATGIRQTEPSPAPYIDFPLSIIESDGDTVTFSVAQKWTHNCSISWMATEYPVSDDDIRCDTETTAIPDQEFTYTAVCVDSVAEVSIYVHDDSFQVDQSATVPAYCSPPDVVGHKVAYNFIVPCGCDDASPSTPSHDTHSCDLREVTFDEKNLAQGAYVSLQWSDISMKLSGKETVDGSGGYMPNGQLRLFDTSTPVSDNGYGTTGLAGDYGNVLIVQQTGGNDQWKANEAGGIMVIDFASPVSEVAEIGLLNVVDDVWVQVTDVDGSIRTIVVGASGSGSSKIAVIDIKDVVQIQLVLSGPTAVTHLQICQDAPTQPALQTTVVDSRELHKATCDKDVLDDFETAGQSDSWTHGSEYNDPMFSTFLGRLGREHPQVSKTFEVPTEAESVDITFDIYDIDGITKEDKVYVGIQGSFLDLDLFASDGNKKYYNDIEVTGDVSSSGRISFRYDDYDTIYAVSMRIPKYWYIDYDNKLPIAFKIETANDISTQSYGIDNVRIHANCQRRNLMEPVAEPDEDGDDGSFYCSAKDFPCEGGDDMVYVCHYSTRKGYETFCVPEPDSEILRFYSNDYCGPCVGGFGGVHWQQQQQQQQQQEQ